jgi:hypothetical protein
MVCSNYSSFLIAFHDALPILPAFTSLVISSPEMIPL